jgi:hypothetical protein
MVLAGRRPRTVVGCLVACQGPVRLPGLGAGWLPPPTVTSWALWPPSAWTWPPLGAGLGEVQVLDHDGPRAAGPGGGDDAGDRGPQPPVASRYATAAEGGLVGWQASFVRSGSAGVSGAAPGLAVPPPPGRTGSRAPGDSPQIGVRTFGNDH